MTVSTLMHSSGHSKPRTLGELKRIPDFDPSGTSRSVKNELRRNLLRAIEKGETLFTGVHGYEDTVIPQIVNALLSRHNFILLGLRGQAKSRILRGLLQFLDPEIPVMAGCEINDNPLRPICRGCRERVAAEGDNTPIAWLPREQRYVEKLATPDVTIADIIGDVDPIRAARGGRDLSDELTIHYGLLPRANRGIFAVNELPDLAGKIQVGLFNIMQEGDIQIKGYPVRMPLDVLLVFTANPDDYTARGKIITPLKDRIGSEIRTHYPATVEEGVAITAQEAWVARNGGQTTVEVPRYIREVVEQTAFLARDDKRVDRRSGVSQRLPIACLESVVSNAEQRAVRNHESRSTARIADVYAALPAITGKMELEYEGELRGAENIARELIRGAVGKVFTKYLEGADSMRSVQRRPNPASRLRARQGGNSIEKLSRLGQSDLAVRDWFLFASPGTSANSVLRFSDFTTQGTKNTETERNGFLHSWSGAGDAGDVVKYIRYTKYTGEPGGGVDLQELVKRLSDFFPQSGYQSQIHGNPEMGPEKSMEALRQAIQRALEEGDLLPGQELQDLLDGTPEEQAAKMKEMIDQLMDRLMEEGYVTGQPQVTAPPEKTPRGQVGQGRDRDAEARFEITDKTIDFLGFKTLKDLMASLGKSSFGRHDTRDLSTGVESGGASRAYEFGDTLNLDISATLFNAVRRDGARVPIELDYPDLMVHQTEYQSSCATVLMLDCSHSMILYGEDRFTPAKKVALALSHLIRTKFPGDSLHLVLFHDSAEEVPLGELARVQVGPYYTNTREGLRLAQRILARQKKDMRQIVMITDGKPSALTLDDGRIYKNAFGLDPLVVTQTLEEVGRCRRSGILINTFMLASDHSLIHFVQKVTELCRGKAYFTTPYTLGQYLLMDYMQKKTRHIH